MTFGHLFVWGYDTSGCGAVTTIQKLWRRFRSFRRRTNNIFGTRGFRSFIFKTSFHIQQKPLTVFSGSLASGHKAGNTLLATSDNKKYCCVAANASTPACLAGGNGSLVARRKADTRTFCLICGCKCAAILPRQTVVFVLEECCILLITNDQTRGYVWNMT